MIPRLARALLAEATATLPSLPELARGVPLVAIDRFVAAPTPANYLAAASALREAVRRIQRERIVERSARRSFRRGVESLRTTSAVEPSLAQSLAQLPIDSRSGMRLEALAALIAAHHELAAKVAARPPLVAPPPEKRVERRARPRR
jgi:hypothetical protein